MSAMRRSRAAAAIAALLLLSGCASTGAQLDQAAGDARAAVTGAALALDIAPDTVPPGVLSTALDDAMREVVDATNRVLELPATGRHRDEVLAALREAEDALLIAREHPAAASAALVAARDALEAAGG
jgi:hypothetical protein